MEWGGYIQTYVRYRYSANWLSPTFTLGNRSNYIASWEFSISHQHLQPLFFLMGLQWWVCVERWQADIQ